VLTLEILRYGHFPISKLYPNFDESDNLNSNWNVLCFAVTNCFHSCIKEGGSKLLYHSAPSLKRYEVLDMLCIVFLRM
jgi:hypothetical protein